MDAIFRSHHHGLSIELNGYGGWGIGFTNYDAGPSKGHAASFLVGERKPHMRSMCCCWSLWRVWQQKNNTCPMKRMNTWWDMHRRTKKHLLFPGRIVTALGEIYPTCLLPLYTNWLPAAHLHARKLLSASAFLCTQKKYYQLLLCVQKAHSWRQEFTAHLMPCMRQMKRKTGTQHAGRSEGQYKVRLGNS